LELPGFLINLKKMKILSILDLCFCNWNLSIANLKISGIFSWLNLPEHPEVTVEIAVLSLDVSTVIQSLSQGKLSSLSLHSQLQETRHSGLRTY
jgi:hypothetical protein